MKKYLTLFLFTLLVFLFPFFTYSQVITTVAGIGTEGYTGDNGGSHGATLNWPTSVAVDTFGNIFIADADNNVVRKVHNGIITTVAGTGFRAGTGYGDFTGDAGPATDARLWFPTGVAVDRIGNLYIADNGNNCIRRVDTTGIITTIAGIGGNGNFGYSGDGAIAVGAKLNHPTRVAVDTFGKIYIADAQNSVIRMVDLSANISTIAGTGVTGYGGDGALANAAQLNMPNDVAVDLAGNVYIADMYNNRIRKIDGSGNIKTIAGTGISGFSGDGGAATNAYLFQPSGIAVDDSGNIYFSDLGNARVRMINPHDTILTIAGTDATGFNGDGRPATTAKLWYPEGLAAKNNKDVYIADRGNFRVRRVTYTLVGVNTINNTAASINLFPNPSQGAFTISIKTDVQEIARIVITNVAGEKISEVTTHTNTPVSLKFDEPPGLYFLSAITDEGVLNEKLIVK